MALNKEIINTKGIITSYHKVGNFSITKRVTKEDAIECLICTNVKSFVSEEYRRISEDNSVSNRDYHLKAALEEVAQTPIYELIYNKLKEQTDFFEATNC